MRYIAVLLAIASCNRPCPDHFDVAFFRRGDGRCDLLIHKPVKNGRLMAADVECPPPEWVGWESLGAAP